MINTIKCKKCRILLCHNTQFVNIHDLTDGKDCATITEQKLLFINEEAVPEWILSVIKENNWTKGKLHCTDCNTRIGAFDFISGSKCACDNYTLPAIYLIVSKVDVEKNL